MEYEENYDDFLKHYGVLGMKWGKRKARSTVSSNNKSKNTAITKPKQTPKPKSKPKPTRRELSDEELRAVINRMRLEREYADLQYRSSSRAKVENVVKAMGTAALLTTSVVKIYNNMNTICKVVKAIV